jgi:4a-hydroxytetrahydrobiopterin dehydratase
VTEFGRERIAQRLESLPAWHHRGNTIEKHFDRKNFDGAMKFVNAVAAVANAQDHHPDITISWNEVTLTLSSHDVGGITERDFRLAAAIETLACEPA